MQQNAESSRMPHRTAWKKDPKTKEAVWPSDLESCLLDGLREFRGRQKLINRCIFLSSYIQEKTGKYRSPQQISSRLQMIPISNKDSKLADLILSTKRKSPRSSHTHVFRLDGSPQRRHEPSYEDNIQIPSPLSNNARLSPHFEPPNAQWNQPDNWILNVDHGQTYTVGGRAIESVYSPAASTEAYNLNDFNDDLLWEQVNPYNDNTNNLQEDTFAQTHPSVGVEPNPFEWFNYQYPGYQQ